MSLNSTLSSINIQNKINQQTRGQSQRGKCQKVKRFSKETTDESSRKLGEQKFFFSFWTCAEKFRVKVDSRMDEQATIIQKC